jgi:hypothetical protein
MTRAKDEQIAALDLHNLFVDDVKLESEFLGIAKVTQNKIFAFPLTYFIRFIACPEGLNPLGVDSSSTHSVLERT